MIRNTDFVLRRTIAFERVLKERLGATGSGLGAMVRQVKFDLPRSLTDKLFFIARQRNAVAHDGAAIDFDEFGRIAEEARQMLNELLTAGKYLNNRESVRAWLDRCPVNLTEQTRNRILSAVRRGVDGDDDVSVGGATQGQSYQSRRRR